MAIDKNVGGGERLLRLVAGGSMVCGGIVWALSSPLGWLLGGCGLMLMGTGIAGYCPACALAGRKPRSG